jgi:NADH-quinone oxidoreductase subunit B
MKYNLTRATPVGEKILQYPDSSSQVVNDPLQDQVDKNIFMTKLEDMAHLLLRRDGDSIHFAT